ncbi:MAG: hypothetical protein EBY39_13395 [Flavobacteriia bacterium]|nr:hypothetical protein [Flavobacteriia bacterium]
MQLVKDYKTENHDYLFIRNTLKKGYTHLNTIVGLCRKVGMKEANRKITDLVKMGQIEQVIVQDEDGDIKYKYFPKQDKPSCYSAAGIESIGGWQSDGVLKGKLTFDKLLNCISKYYNIPVKEITGNHRKREKVICRQMFCYIAKENMPEASLKSIGNFLGGRDHSTAIHSIQKASDLMTVEKKFKKDYIKLNEFIKINL